MKRIELTQFQKEEIPSPKIGTVIFQTDGDIGYYKNTKEGWVRIPDVLISKAPEMLDCLIHLSEYCFGLKDYQRDKIDTLIKQAKEL